MNEQNENRKQADCGCGSGCSCHGAGSAGKTGWIVGLIVVVAVGALVARGMVKNNAAPSAKGNAVPAVSKQPAATPAATPEKDAVKEIESFSELNAVAMDMAGVFVFVPGKGETVAKAPLAQMRGAAKTIEEQGQKIGLFALKGDSPDYEQLASQMTAPGVLALVEGGGMKAVSGDFTEANLVQAFLDASSAGGCGPAGCGSEGCGSEGCK